MADKTGFLEVESKAIEFADLSVFFLVYQLNITGGIRLPESLDHLCGLSFECVESLNAPKQLCHSALPVIDLKWN